MTFTVGLTGGIGSGKSAAANLFGDLGAQIVDTDVIAHRLTSPAGAAMPAIRLAFGDEVIDTDGSLDRKTMRQRIFADTAERSRLEAILHPLIRTEAEAQIRQTDCRSANADFSPYAILVVPLLVESGGRRKQVDRVAVVDCPEALQIERVMQRGLAESEVQAILAAQATRTRRLTAADDIIRNDGSLDDLRTQVQALHARYLELSRGTAHAH